MKFKNYLTESKRVWSIDNQEFLDTLLTRCPKNLKDTLNGNEIYRGNNSFEDFLFGNSNKGTPRESSNTLNYYTLMIDNSKYWKNYPKRSRSFICASYDPPYGDNQYIVIPYDNTPIGICPEPDIWESFEKTLNMDSLESFNIVIHELFNLDDESTWKELKKALNNNELNSKYIDEYITLYPFLINWYENGGNDNSPFTDEWEKAFDPKKNGFKLVKSLKEIPKEREVWFSGKAIFIIKEEFDDALIEELKDLL